MLFNILYRIVQIQSIVKNDSIYSDRFFNYIRPSKYNHMALNRQQVDNLGFDNKADKNRKRTINQDGSFNIVRKNDFFREFSLYRWGITCKWHEYWLAILAVYIVINFLFATIYLYLGPENIVGIRPDKEHPYWQCFFFSLQTFTTVGYGGLHPQGILVNATAGFEAFLGLMTFAIATGTLYGRYSRPIAKIRYSPNAIIAPFNGQKALMFVIANDSKGNLVEVTAKLNISWKEKDATGNDIRKFNRLALEYEKINMLPLTWTIVHPIDDQSFLYNMTEKDFIEKDIELFILITSYDDTFAQTVHSRSSYVATEIIYGAKFNHAFSISEDGTTILELNKVGDYQRVEF